MVDGGSTDATVSEARQAGAQVGHLPPSSCPNPFSCCVSQETSLTWTLSSQSSIRSSPYRGTEVRAGIRQEVCVAMRGRRS